MRQKTELDTCIHYLEDLQKECKPIISVAEWGFVTFLLLTLDLYNALETQTFYSFQRNPTLMEGHEDIVSYDHYDCSYNGGNAFFHR